MISVVQADADQFSRTRNRSKPVSIARGNPPTLVLRFGKCLLIAHECFSRRARCLEPLTIYIEPRQWIPGTVGAREKFFAIETIACVAIALLQEDAQSWFAPAGFFGCKRDDVHRHPVRQRRAVVDDHVKLLRAVYSDRQR